MSILTDYLARRHGGRAQSYERLNAPLEGAGVAVIRARLAADMRGRTLEVGCGTGLNFRYYTAGTRVTAVEPLADFRAFAAARAAACAAHIEVIDADAQALPFADATFDAGLATLVFCSVPDARRGLSELRRVVRPGAPVRFFEHVRSKHRLGALAQDLANPLWRWLLDGCNLNRDTIAAIRAAGFTVGHVAAHRIEAPGVPPLPLREVHATA
jgi:SAM-dependent methyltransferase